MMSGGNPDIDELKRMVKAIPIVEVVGRYVTLTRKGFEYVARCPFHAEKSPSFSVHPVKNFYHCFGCGAHGDGIKFVMEMDNVDFMTAVKSMSETFGFSVSHETKSGIKAPARPVQLPAPKVERNIGEVEWARRKLKQSIPAAGTIVETYLQSRGIDIAKLQPDILRQLRFIELDYFAPLKNGGFKNMGTFPVMFSPMQYRDGSIQAAHLTYLMPDGSGKLKLKHPDDDVIMPAKKMRGAAWGCAIRLGPPTKYMGLSEGIENGLTFMMARQNISVWVAGSIANMAGKGIGVGKQHPNPTRANHRLPSVIPDRLNAGIEVPLMVERVYIVCDNDSKDQVVIDALIERAAARIALRKIPVRLVRPPAGCDLNDVVMMGAGDVVHG